MIQCVRLVVARNHAFRSNTRLLIVCQRISLRGAVSGLSISRETIDESLPPHKPTNIVRGGLMSFEAVYLAHESSDVL